MKGVLQEFITRADQLVGITGDNASVPVKVGKDFLEKKLCQAALGCAIHKINLGLKAAEKAVPAVTQAYTAIKAFVTYTHHSPQAMAFYLSECPADKKIKPVQMVDT